MLLFYFEFGIPAMTESGSRVFPDFKIRTEASARGPPAAIVLRPESPIKSMAWCIRSIPLGRYFVCYF